MKKIITITCFFFFLFGVKAQNLVPNPSFEEIECFVSDEQNPRFSGFQHWYNANFATPDAWGLYDTCAINDMFSFQVAITGEFQLPRTDTTMAGLSALDPAGAPSRDILGVRLLDALEADTLYYLSMWVSKGNRHNYGCDGLGMLLSSDSLFSDGSGILGPSAQVHQPFGEVILDTLDWFQVSGFYQALGGEEFLYIGNHFSNDETSYELVTGTANYPWAYYFYDDIEVLKASQVNTENQLDTEDHFHWYIKGNSFHLQGNVSGLWEVFDASGRKVAAFEVEQGRQAYSWPMALESGVYVFRNKEKQIRCLVE